MKKTLFTLAFLALTFVTINAQTVWTLDKAHSKMAFTVVHLTMSEVDGVFKEYEATITASNPDFSDAVVEATADLTTLDTNNSGRNDHLQKDDMFDTANHPSLHFKSTSIKKVDEKMFKLTGDLTIKGITKSVSLDFKLLGTGQNPRSKKDMAGFKLTGTIDRTDFGVGNMPAMMVGHDVVLTASGEFIKQ